MILLLSRGPEAKKHIYEKKVNEVIKATLMCCRNTPVPIYRRFIYLFIFFQMWHSLSRPDTEGSSVCSVNPNMLKLNLAAGPHTTIKRSKPEPENVDV